VIPSLGIAGVFEQACRWKGEQPFLLDSYVRWTGREAWRQARTVASALRAKGVAKGSVVGFFCLPSARHAVAFFACQMLGAVCCALHTKDTDLRLQKALGRIGAEVLIGDSDQSRRLSGIAGAAAKAPLIVHLDRSQPGSDDLAASDDMASSLETTPISPNDTAVLFFSSGSTGDPKCVVHSQKTVLETAFAGSLVYGVSDPSDGVSIPMSPSFAAWLHTVLPFVALRGKIFFHDAFDPLDYLETLAAEGMTVAALVPSVWNMVLGQEFSGDMTRLRMAFYSGEKGSTKLIRELAAFAPAVRTAYLATEGGCAAGIVAPHEVLVGRDLPTAVGQPIPGADLKLIDPEGGFDDVVAPGQTGEVAISGGSLALGYLGDDLLTRAQFHDGWWRSGDLGVLDEQGLLTIRGRKDNRINTGGIKVHAEEIENVLLSHPAVRGAAVIGAEDAEFGQRIEAHLVVDDASVTPSDVLSYCERSRMLPRALLPKAIHFHPELPTSPTGKLYRKGLSKSEA
jgi:acyl-CoA synthetase (AMP-forming)/AMP-acid ligase II